MDANEMKKFYLESAIRSAREQLELVIRRREEELRDALRDAQRLLARFDEAVADMGRVKELRVLNSTPSEILSSAVHLFAQVGSNDRLDLFVTRAVALAKMED